MSMLNEPIPVPCFNVAYNQDGSDECTIITSNAGHSECASNLISDEGIVTTHFSTDAENENGVGDYETKIPSTNTEETFGENGSRQQAATISQRVGDVKHKTTCAPREICAIRFGCILTFSYKRIASG